MVKNPFKLEKLKIKVFNYQERNNIEDTFEAMFNPESYSLKYENVYHSYQGINTSGSTAKYSLSKPQRLSLKFILDDTGVADYGLYGFAGASLVGKISGKKDVYQQVNRFLNLTTYMDGEIHEPKFLKIEWGDLIFDCRLQSVDITYTLFNRSGQPIRAELDTVFIGDIKDSKRIKQENKNSPDLTHRRTIKAGDNLPLIAQEVYGDSAYYLKLASVNNLNSLRQLKIGTTINLPPIKKSTIMTGVVTTTILSNGIEMNPEYNLMSIDIIKEANKIPFAQLILLDGDASQQKFAISNTDFFKPGNELEIKLRYEDRVRDEATVFQGIIIKHSVRADLYRSYLSIDLKDAAIKLTTQRKSTVFREMTDTEIIKKIIQETGLKFISTANTQAKHQEMVQFYCTDWDFILSRADANGCWVLADDGEITLQKPELKGRPKHTFEYGIRDIYEFEMEADLSHQYTSVESMTWDVKTQEISPPQKAKSFSLTQGNLNPDKLAKTLNADNYQLVTLGQLDKQEMQAWADAKLLKSRLSMLQGRLKVPGFADIKPGDIMEVAGIGERFKGKTLVSAIRHQVNEQGWQTDVQFGLSANWFTQQNNDIIDTPASGLVPAINGLQIGIVDKYEDDPDKQYRVKVNIPSIEKDGLVGRD